MLPSGPTSSGGTRVLGFAAVGLLAATALFGLVLSPGDVNQSDAVRLLYLHVPTATRSHHTDRFHSHSTDPTAVRPKAT